MNVLLFALDPEPGQPPGQAPGFFGLSPLFLIGLMVLFYVVVLLPMTRREKKDQEQQLATLKRGAKVLTNAGIVGTVVSAKDGEDEIVIRSEDTKLRIKRNVVVQVLGADDAETAKQ
jgi:preprotein translocase subunit YajC